jgi:hypothetical protein
MKSITREKIKVDRVACPWLIRNCVDPEAEFVFLPHETDWAKIDNAIVFDVPNCELGHHGEDVSFNSILKKYALTDPALVLLGEIVRAADSRPSNPHPAGEGLTDHEILDHEFVVYDALHAECKRRVSKP